MCSLCRRPCVTNKTISYLMLCIIPAPNPINILASRRNSLGLDVILSRYVYNTFASTLMTKDTMIGSRVRALNLDQSPNNGDATNWPMLYEATTQPRKPAAELSSNWNKRTVFSWTFVCSTESRQISYEWPSTRNKNTVIHFEFI